MAADQELKDWLISQGHTEERAEQIAGNHPDATRLAFETWKKAQEAPAQEVVQEQSNHTRKRR